MQNLITKKFLNKSDKKKGTNLHILVQISIKKNIKF